MSDLPLKCNIFSYKLIVNSLILPETMLRNVALSIVLVKLQPTGAFKLIFDLNVVVLISTSVIENVILLSSFLPTIIIQFPVFTSGNVSGTNYIPDPTNTNGFYDVKISIAVRYFVANFRFRVGFICVVHSGDMMDCLKADVNHFSIPPS